MAKESLEQTPQPKKKRVRSFLTRHQSGLIGFASAGISVYDVAEGLHELAVVNAAIAAIGIGKEVSKTRQRNRWLRGESAFKEHTVKGLSLAENTELITTLSSYLGITFPHAPEKIVFSWKEAPRLLKKSSLSHLLGISRRATLGLYIPQLNAYVTKETKTNPRVELHEAMHSYIHQKNKNIERAQQSVVVFDKYSSPVPKDTVTAYSCMDEGMAEYATRKVLGQMAEQVAETNPSWSSVRDGLTKQPKVPTQEQFDVIANIGTIRSHHAYKGLYPVGLWFVDSVMTKLTTAGMALNEAIDTVIANPPHTTAQLRKPREYASTLLSAN